MNKPVFISRLLLPQGFICQFKVYKLDAKQWEFINENLAINIFLSYVYQGSYTGSFSMTIGNKVQEANLICQAAFELDEYYRNNSIKRKGL